VKPVQARAVAAAALARCAPPGAAASSMAPGADADLARFCAKPAWRDAGKTLVKALSAATGTSLQEAPAPAAGLPERYDTRITLGMIDVRARIRLELGIFTTLDCGHLLVRRALHVNEPQSEEITEFLSEMCNQVLGTLKSAMRVSGLQFTLLVPRMRFVHAADGWSARFPASRAVHVVAPAGVAMMLVLGARPCVTRTLEIPALRENMVLVEDLKDDGGTILAEASTRLTANVLVRIKTRAAERSARVAD
jgi:hypothetical protein